MKSVPVAVLSFKHRLNSLIINNNDKVPYLGIGQGLLPTNLELSEIWRCQTVQCLEQTCCVRVALVHNLVFARHLLQVSSNVQCRTRNVMPVLRTSRVSLIKCSANDVHIAVFRSALVSA